MARISNEKTIEYTDKLRKVFGVKRLSNATLARITWHFKRKEYEKCTREIMKQMNVKLNFHLVIRRIEYTRAQTDELILQKARMIWLLSEITPVESYYDDDNDFTRNPAMIIFPINFPLYHDPRFEKSHVIIVVHEKVISNSLATFCACLAHEIAHILLRSVSLPVDDEEIAADIVAMILGFIVTSYIDRKPEGLRLGYVTTEQLFLVWENIFPPLEIIYL